MRAFGEPVVPRIGAFAQVRGCVVASRPVRRILYRRFCRTVGGGHPSRPAVARRLQRPTRGCLRTGRPPPAWPCSRWGLPSRPGRPGRWCALTAPFHPYLCGTAPETGPAIGGLFSVALSCGSPRLGVTQHRARWSPDVPRTGAPKRPARGRLADSPPPTIVALRRPCSHRNRLRGSVAGTRGTRRACRGRWR